MTRRASVAIRVAPEFAALVKRMARFAAQGQPMTRGRSASLPAVTGVLARLLIDSPLNSAGWWVVPSMGDILKGMTPPEGDAP